MQRSLLKLLSRTYLTVHWNQSWKVMIKCPLLSKPFPIENASYKLLPILTILYVSFKYILISLPSFKAIPNLVRTLYNASLRTGRQSSTCYLFKIVILPPLLVGTHIYHWHIQAQGLDHLYHLYRCLQHQLNWNLQLPLVWKMCWKISSTMTCF